MKAMSKKAYRFLQNQKNAKSLMLAVLQNKQKIMNGETVQFDVIEKDANGIEFVAKGILEHNKKMP